MVLAVVLDGEGRPLCTEMLPGNTADVTVLLPIVDRLRDRFAVGRVCVVADLRPDLDGNHSGPRRPPARIHPGGTGTQQRSDP